MIGPRAGPVHGLESQKYKIFKYSRYGCQLRVNFGTENTNLMKFFKIQPRPVKMLPKRALLIPKIQKVSKYFINIKLFLQILVSRLLF
jgi:hypothetical protein